MAEEKRRNIDKTKSKRIDAGIAGASGGTLLILFSRTLPDASAFKPILLYLAPSISIVLSTFWIGIKKELNNYNRNKKLNLVLRKLDIFMSDPTTSPVHKELLRQKREEIQLAIVSKQMMDVENLNE